MSTPGKVLVVLIMLASLVWVILTAGVTQFNRNGNEALIRLTNQVAKLQDDVKTAQDDIVRIKDQTTVLQEKMDRDLAVIQARQNDVQRISSNVHELVSRLKYEVATVQETLQNAEKDRAERIAEVSAETKLLADARQEVVQLKTKDQELTARLVALRDEFTKTLKSNSGAIGSQ